VHFLRKSPKAKTKENAAPQGAAFFVVLNEVGVLTASTFRREESIGMP